MEGEDEYRLSDFLEYMSPPTLSSSRPTSEANYWVFWSKEEDKDCPDQTKTLSSCDLTETRTINFNLKDYLLSALRKYASYWHKELGFNILVQIWAPKTIGDQLLLTTSHQPFALEGLHRGLCEYRKHCLSLEFNVNGNDKEFGGIIGQVFRRQKGVSYSVIESYSVKQYPQRDFALKCGVWRSLHVPLFNPSGRCCASVVELLHTGRDGISDDLYWLGTNILEIWIPCCTSPNELCYFPYLSCSDEFSSSITQDGMDGDVEEFNDLCCDQNLTKGQGIVGKALLYDKPFFCRDVTQLPAAEYPLPNSAHAYGLTGCYAICLHSTLIRNHNYVLEFFLPPNWNTISGDPHTFLKLL